MSRDVAGRLAWYWERLRAMSPPEVQGRLLLAARKRAWRRRTRWEAPLPALRPSDPWRPGAVPAEPGLLDEAEAYMRGEYRLLNLSYVEAGPDWHRDPQSGARTGLGFGLDLDYRDPAIAGNVKNTWEKNRHHHLTVLAQAYALTGEARYADEVERQLVDWVSANPFPLGINWTSMLELGVRLIAWVWIERFLRGSASHAALFGPQGLMWSPIYWSQWLLARHEAFGSSANNHLVGEAAGAFLAASLWPYFPESEGWARHARAVLEREIEAQTFPSGLNREQAASYHLFSLELFLLPAIEGERLGAPFSAAYKNWLVRMLEVIPRVTDVRGALPRFGDEDEGMAVQLRPLASSRTAWLFHLGRAFLGARVPAPQGPTGRAAAAWLWDAPGEALLNEAPRYEAPAGSEALADAGLYVLAARRGRPDELLCLADAGPLGFLSIAGHGHADALSFALSVGGRRVVVDPGTYIYHAEPGWRSYFRSTRAHNTVVVDGVDQSVARGPFLWGRQQAVSKVLAWEPTAEGARLEAEHDGYTRLAKGVVHRRTFALDGAGLSLHDALEGEGEHELEWCLHFAPECAVSLEDGRCSVRWPEGRLALDLDPRLSWRLARGEEDAGWYSAGFNLKEPTFTLLGRFAGPLPIRLQHRLEVRINDEN